MKAKSLIRRTLGRWTRLVVRRARSVVLLALVTATVGAAYAAGHLGVDTNTEEMLSPEVPFRQTLTQYRSTFPQLEAGLLIVVEATTPELARRTAREIVGQLEQRPDLVESVYLPGDEEFFERNAFLYLSQADLKEVLSRLETARPFLELLFADPSVRGLSESLSQSLSSSSDGPEEGPDPALISVITGLGRAIESILEGTEYQFSWQQAILGDDDDRTEPHRSFVIAQPVLDYSSPLPGANSLSEVREIASGLERRGFQQVRVRLTGSAALEYEEMESVSRTGALAGLAAMILVLLILWFGLRSVRLVASTMLTLGVGLIYTGVFAAAAVGHLNVISVAFAVLYIGLGVDYAIHLTLRFRELYRDATDRTEALATAVEDVGPALLLCAGTTSIGFFAFLPTAYRGVAELGLISGAGMFLALFVSVTLLPALLYLWSPSPSQEVGTGIFRAIGRQASNLVARKGGWVRKGSLAVGLVGVIGVLGVEFDANPNHLRDPGTESVQAFEDLLASENDAPWTMTLLSGSEDDARERADRLETLPSVESTRGIWSFVPEDQGDKLALIFPLREAISGGRFDWQTEPPPTSEEEINALRRMRTLLTLGGNLIDDRSGAAMTQTGIWAGRLATALHRSDGETRARQISRLHSNLLTTLKDVQSLLNRALSAGPVAAADIPMSIQERWVSSDGIHRIEIMPEDNLGTQKALLRFVGEVQRLEPETTDLPAIYVGAGSEVVRAFRQAFTLALVAIGLVLLAVFRNIRDMSFVLFPLFLAGAVTGGAAFLIGVPLNFANIIVLPLLFGLGVDNGIHIVHRVRSGMLSSKVLRSSTGQGVFLSGATTLLSFSSLGFTAHRGISTMGQLLGIGVFMILFFTLIALPAFMAGYGSEAKVR